MAETVKGRFGIPVGQFTKEESFSSFLICTCAADLVV